MTFSETLGLYYILVEVSVHVCKLKVNGDLFELTYILNLHKYMTSAVMYIR